MKMRSEISSCLKQLKSLVYLGDMRVARKVIFNIPPDIEIHCLCDASQLAYGAVVYVESTDQADTPMVKLLCSKSRVAPIKVISLRRLELCAALPDWQ